MTEQNRKTVRVRISGRVQGVCFRIWTVEQAHALKLDGWVRNRRDGSVEAVFSGSPTAVEDMIRRCWEGPPAADVDQVSQTAEPGPVGSGFRQALTA
jgi:acylphosphatase